MTSTAVDIRSYAPEFHVFVNGQRLAGDISKTILSISVNQELNRLNDFSFQVQDEVYEGEFRLIGNDLFKYSNDLSIHLGYTQRLFKMVEGKIQNIDAEFSQGLAPTFTVQGSDPAYKFLTNKGESYVFKKKTDSGMVEEIVSNCKSGIKATVEPTEGEYPGKIKQAGESYLDFMKNLAQANGFELILSGRNLYFGPDQGDRQPVLSLTWGRELISFKPSIDTSRLVSEVRVRAWDRNRRQPIEGRAQAGEEGPQKDGARMASQITREIYGDVIEVITDQPVRDRKEADLVALSRLKEDNSDFISGSGETIGLPEMKPGSKLELDGLGTWFRGLYTVTKVIHSIDSSGFHTRFNAHRSHL